MGCTQSNINGTHSRSNAQNGNSDPAFHPTKSNPLSEREIQQRIDAPAEAQTLSISGLNFRYAWVSQRGYYPESLDKDNQDAFMIMPSLGNTKDQAYFGIYDGHGKDGHHCARYARDHLAKNIVDKLERIPAVSVTTKTIKTALTMAHLATNEAMHTDKRFDDSLSGTTSISVLIRGKMMYVCNVGDSRAVIVSTESDGRLVAKPMSSDQTPYRKDERERCKKYGARILSMDQIEGLEPEHENWGDLNLGEDIDEGGDPPRIWSPNGDYPGTAFTRSLGDLFAEECGVVAEPEILEREILPNDRYVVIASDGVFEFLTNQMVAEIIARYSDPIDACKAVVAESYNMWLQYEVRTDDITIIALYIDPARKNSVFHDKNSSFHSENETSPVASPSGTASLVRDSPATMAANSTSNHVMQTEARPVRRVMSREKKKNMIQLHGEDDHDFISEEEMAAQIVAKSSIDAGVISNAIKSNFLFQHLSAQQRSAVIGVMRQVDVQPGDWIIKQGDQGDRFYIVDTGRFEVRVRTLPFPPEDASDNSPDKPHIGGTVVHVYESGPEQHPGFGELSLMYGKPRAASVIALTAGKLWSLDRRVFKRVVLRPKDMRKDSIRTLKKVELLKCLNVTQLQRLTDLLNETTYKAGSYIITQGERGENFYMIVSGQCDCTINCPDGGPEKVVLQLKENNYFGERALLESKPRAANVIARVETKVLFIGKQAFEEVLGPLSKIIDEDRLRREAQALLEATAPKKLKDMTVCGIISSDTMGPLLLGAFHSAAPNICVRSFVLTEIDKQLLSDSVLRYIEASKSVLLSNMSNAVVPKQMSMFRDPNAVHLLFNSPVVADLSSLVRDNSEAFAANPDFVVFIFASLVCGLETLHAMNIIYRAVQPESLYVDSEGRVVLMDFRVCKVGITGISERAFTICGASDYLAPEQISQTGHSYPVDLWGMGVLLYEIAIGSHPFSSSSEVATYSKISSFGSKSFPALKFPDNTSADLKSLINQLLMPTPEARIGAGPNGFQLLKKHPYFKAYHGEWDRIAKGTCPSPMINLAVQERTCIQQEGVEKSVFDSFELPYGSEVSPGEENNSSSWLSNIEFI